MAAITESFLFGIASSLHCAGMCGPLAAVFHGGWRATASYHVGRTMAYGIAGAVAGAAGGALGLLTPQADETTRAAAMATGLTTDGSPLGQYAPSWIAIGLAAVLIFAAFGGERLLNVTPGIGRWLNRLFQKAMNRTARWPSWGRAAALGAFTPLLPCGVLYAVYGASAATGSWSAGSLTALGFAAGSLPLLAAVQVPAAQLSRWLGPNGVVRLRMIALLTAAAALLWRGLPPLFAEGAPLCCSGG